MGLVLTLRRFDKVIVGETILCCVEVKGKQIKLMFEAPPHIKIERIMPDGTTRSRKIDNEAAGSNENK